MKTGKITYRPTGEKDTPLLKELYASTRTDVVMHAHGLSEDQKKEFIDMQYQLQDIHYKKYYPKADFLIIQLKNKDVGRLYVEEWDAEYRIIDIIIHEDYQNQGLGTNVMQSIIDKAERKYKTVSIHVDKRSKAVDFYKRLGFSVDGGTEVYHLMKRNTIQNSQKTVELIQMQKV